MPIPGVYVHVPVHAHVHIPVHVPAHAHVHVPVYTHVLGQCLCRILVHHGNGQMYGHGHENGYETGLELSDYRTVDYRVEFFANYFYIHVRSLLTLVIFFYDGLLRFGAVGYFLFWEGYCRFPLNQTLLIIVLVEPTRRTIFS
jgi:hypothetical protein